MGQKAITLQRLERVTVLMMVIVLHALTLALVFASRSPIKVSKSVGVLKLFALQAERPATTKPPPRLPSEAIDDTLPAEEIAFSDGADANAEGAPAGVCSTLDVVARALVEDPAAVRSVLHSPPEIRSIAEAVVIWNAGWSPAAKSLNAPLGPARAIIERSLSAIDETCLDEPLAGPRLVAIPADPGTMFLVFGSGQWTWRDITRAPKADHQPGS